MSTSPDSSETGQQLRRALAALKEMRTRLEEMQRAAHEPIAIVGMGCRVPGADSPAAFWQLLRDGVDAISEVPASRWDRDALFDADPEAAGKVATRWGGFLRDVEHFDAGFFGISPREAAQMDPQQRLLLEVAWETLEAAGQPPRALAGSATGVFVGIHSHSNDYYLLQAGDLEQLDAYSGTGSSHSVMSGRISYLLDLRGPSLALDTACSSSLMAVHLAVQSLRRRECSAALAGGVNLILEPTFTTAASRMHMMAADGRCKFGDARADGFVRGEGCGMVFLKRLSDAQAAGDPILAVIRGSATNQDGRSNGLTAPNGPSQVAVLRAALADAGLQPAAIGFVEAHGTGTALGDPIEIEALAEVHGAPADPGQRVLLGSLKANMGHLEGAAGVVGLIKAVLTLQHGEVPPQLHFRSLNPHISLDGTPFEIPTTLRPWPAGDRPRHAGVSSFGWSGTNAHVVLGEAPPLAVPAPAATGAAAGAHLLVLSAQTPAALRDLAAAWLPLLDGDAATVQNLCAGAALRRDHHAWRLAAAAQDGAGLHAALAAFARGEPHPGLVVGEREAQEPPPVAFVFPGQGAQWPGMARKLLRDEPLFAAAIERCEAAMAPFVSWSLRQKLSAEPLQLDESDVIQPMLFAIQVALAALWQSWGIAPAAVVGHSMGEVAAAHVAGALSLEDAARIICVRSKLMLQMSGKGAMAAVGLPQAEAEALLAGREALLAVAVSNSPRSTVLSGDPAALDALLEELRARNVFCRMVKIDVASHSPQMDPLLPELARALVGITPQPAHTPFVSTVTGARLVGDAAADALGAAYWPQNLRRPVRFADAVAQLSESGVEAFVELSPHPILLASVDETLQHHGRAGLTAPSLRRDADERLTMLTSLGALYVQGAIPNWQALYPAGSPPVTLPGYPWQRKRFWLPPATTQRVRMGAGVQTQPEDGWLYEMAWQRLPAQAAAPAQPPRMLILADQSGTGAALAQAVAAQGGEAALVYAGAPFARRSDGAYSVDSADDTQLARLLAEVKPAQATAQAAAWDVVVHLWALDAEGADADPMALQPAVARGALGIAQALARVQGDAPRLWLVTRGAQPAGGSVVAPAQATLWGMGRVIGNEHPERWGGLVDLDSAEPAQSAPRLLAALQGGGGEQQIALRGAERLGARLVRSAAAPAQEARLDAQGSYLITGGLGGVGLALARWMAGHGAGSIVLLGRRAADDNARAAMAAIEQAGARVAYLRADVAETDSLAAALAEIAATLPPLRGVVHAAGILEDGTLLSQQWQGFEQVMRSKVAGAWNLHLQTAGLDLQHFVLCSSASSLIGTPGQANYAAANAFLDALAHTRRAAGLPALSINWGRWGEVGLAAQAGRDQNLQGLGLNAMAPDAAAARFGRVLHWPQAQLLLADVDWPALAERLPAGSATPLLRELLREPTLQSAEAPAMPPLLATLAQTPAASRYATCLEAVRTRAAAILRLDGVLQVEPNRGFFQMGMDSLMALELRNQLGRSLGLTFPTTLAFDYPTAAGLTRFLLAELFPAAAEAAAEAEGGLEAEAELESLGALSDDDLRALLDAEIDAVDL